MLIWMGAQTLINLFFKNTWSVPDLAMLMQTTSTLVLNKKLAFYTVNYFLGIEKSKFTIKSFDMQFLSKSVLNYF